MVEVLPVEASRHLSFDFRQYLACQLAADLASARERRLVESLNQAAHRLGRAFHARREIGDDLGIDVELPVEELFQEHRLQQAIIRRLDLGHRYRTQPGPQIRELNGPVRGSGARRQQNVKALFADKLSK